MRRLIALSLSLCLIALSPGLEPYRLLAGTVGVEVPQNVGSPSVGSAGANSANLSLTGGISNPAGTMLQPGLDAALPSAVSLNPAVQSGGIAPALSAAQGPAVSQGVAARGPPAGIAGIVDKAAPSSAKSIPVLSVPVPAAPKAVVPAAVRSVADAGAVRAVQTGKDVPTALDTLFSGGRSRAGADVSGPVKQAAPGILGDRSAGLGKAAAQAAKETPSVDFLQAAAEKKSAAPQQAKGVIAKLKGSMDGFNKSEKSFIVGQTVFLLAISIYLATLPLLVQALTGDAAMSGVARAVHYWVFAGASLFSGSIVQRTPMKRVLVGAALTRAVVFGTIGLLAITNILPWTGFLLLVGANAVVVSMNHLVDIDTDGARKVFSSDKKIEQAGYLYDFIYYGMMLAIPPLIGIPMDWLDAAFGPGIGAAVGFSAFAAVMSVAAFIYAKYVKVIGEDFGASQAAGLLRKLRGLLATGWSILKETPQRTWRTAKIILANKKILSRSFMATAENFVEDALFAVVIPSFAIDILRAGATGNGLLLSAVTFGGLLASTFLVRYAQRIQNRIGTYNFLAILTVAAATAFIPSIGLWLAPSLLWAVPAVALMKLAYQPLRSRMRALLQVEIKNDPAAQGHSQEIFSLMTVVEVLAAGAGGLAFSWIFMNAGPGTLLFGLLGASAPMKIVTMALMGISAVYVLGLTMLKGQIPTWARFKSAKGAEAKELQKLDTNLKKLGYKPVKTVKIDEAVSVDRPTVAVLAPASLYKLSIVREGGRQSPGDVHLALDPSWLIQEKLPDGRTRVLLRKGLFFDAEGTPWLAEYEVPRPARYFANFFTLGANDRDDGVPFESDLDVPQSNSVKLESVTNDKFFTRLLLAAKGVGVPATLAFLMAAHPLAAQAGKYSQPQAGIQVESMPPAASRKAELRRSVEAYLKANAARLKGQVVVKPSGPQWHSSKGVKFFSAKEVDAIVDHVLALSADSQMTPDGAVLIDGRLTPPALYFRSTRLDGLGLPDAKDAFDSMGIRVDGDVGVSFLSREESLRPDVGKAKKDWNMRVLISRTPWGGAELSGIFIRAGAWGIPTVAEPGGPDGKGDPEDAAVVVKYEDVLAMLRKQHGLLKTEAEVAAFTRRLEELGERALAALSENEAAMAREPGDPRQAQTDYIGLDVMLQADEKGLTPMVIEINDHDSGGQMHMDRFYPDRAGEHSRGWVATMLARARRDALKGKRVLVVGGGYPGKRYFFERAQKLGVKVVLVDKPGSWAAGLVDEFIPVDTLKPDSAVRDAVGLLESKGLLGTLDGITTIWEDDVPLTSSLAEKLGLPYFPVESARIAREKNLTRKVMAEAGLPTPRFATVHNPADLEKAMDQVGFPAILKPVSGAEAKFVKEVGSKEEARRVFKQMSDAIAAEAQSDGAFSSQVGVVMEQFLDGDEVDVDVIMRGGKAVYSSVTDNWPTRRPFFLATGSSLPSHLPQKGQDQLSDLAVKTAQAMKLGDGVLHIEMKLTSEGPRVIEVNARIGGTYVHDWVKAVYGVDLAEEALLAAVGVPSRPYKPRKPLTHLEGEFLIPERSGTLLKFGNPLVDAGDPGLFELKRMKQVGSDVRVPPDGNDRVGMLTSKGADTPEAEANLKRLKASQQLEIESGKK